jgi:hypothetical protein
MPRGENLTGQRFGRLMVIKFYERTKSGHSRWLCECDCGNSTIVYGNSLKRGITSSCGCLGRERVIEAVRTHGMSRSGVYAEYRNMKNRCYNENAHNYKWYGGRGIKMCDRWRDSIKDFYDDVSVLPNFRENGYTLDRIDNDGNYEPGNVRWATKSEQCNNRSNNIRYEYDGETHTLKEISDITGIPYKVLHKRLKTYGWEPERAFTTEMRKVSKPNNPYVGDNSRC